MRPSIQDKPCLDLGNFWACFFPWLLSQAYLYRKAKVSAVQMQTISKWGHSLIHDSEDKWTKIIPQYIESPFESTIIQLINYYNWSGEWYFCFIKWIFTIFILVHWTSFFRSAFKICSIWEIYFLLILPFEFLI